MDIGCSDRRLRQFLRSPDNYTGLDYYGTATEWYNSKPDVYGDAQALPICRQCIDTAVLLDVLEHLPYPEKCLSEIQRVLKPAGKLIMQVPFIYPLHDSPLDFHRWTIHGLCQLANDSGFEIKEKILFGRPLETAAMLSNIALCRVLSESIRQRSIFSIFMIFLPIFIPVINVSALIASRLNQEDDMMPFGCQILCIRK